MKAKLLLATLACLLALTSVAGNDIKNLNIFTLDQSSNRLLLGLSVEETTWLGDTPEFLPRIGLDFLAPISNRLSVGAFVGSVFLGIDGGVLAGWSFANNSRIICGLGYTATYETPLLRLGYKAPGGFYVSGSVGPDFKDGACNIGLGIGYFVLGGRRK